MKPTKAWVARARDVLRSSLLPIPVEKNELDWKSNLSPKAQRLAEHLSAFGNQPGGGFLVFGIDNPSANIVGISAKQAETIVAQLANIGRDALEPPLVIDHSVFKWRGKPLLVVYIAEQLVRPVHLRGKSLEYAWIRSGGSTRKASRYEIGRLMLNSEAPRWEKMRASSRLSIEEALNLLDTDAIARLLGKPLPNNPNGLLEWMAHENALEPHGEGTYITNFGAVATAKNLRLFASLERKSIRIIRYRGLNKVDTIDEQVHEKGYAIGFEDLIDRLKLLLPHSEIIKRALRTTTAVYPSIALLELIANALIHQDFTLSGTGPMIEIFDNRIEFTNPGSLLPGKIADRLIGTTPHSRNELLASTFRRYGLCEERGTGFQKVIAAVELFGLPPLSFVEADDAFKVILYKPRKFAEMSQAERVEACYQHAVISYLSSGALTNTSLRERLKMSERQRNQVTNLIADAVSAGRIKRKAPDSANKFAEYIPYWV